MNNYEKIREISNTLEGYALYMADVGHCPNELRECRDDDNCYLCVLEWLKENTK